MKNTLEIKNLTVSIEGQRILKDFNLTIPKGEVHALMGPNGTGKSTLARVIAGHEDYTVESGEVFLDGENILGKEPDEIAHSGLFLAFQYPLEIPGVSIANFIRAARQSRLPEGESVNAVEFYKELYQHMDALKIDRAFTSRSLNEGFSGGEKKRCEILQMSMLAPSYCVMDETDSGLDIDALKVVASGVNHMRNENRGFLIITHYQRLLDYIVPDVVHVMAEGRIVHSGDSELARELEAKGYDGIQENFAGAGA